MTRFIIVDCESTGPTPATSDLTEFAAVELAEGKSFYGKMWETNPYPENNALPLIDYDAPEIDKDKVINDFNEWVFSFGERCVFISDNPAFDFMWIAFEFDKRGMKNPFGYSARRIGDLAAGLSGKWRNTNAWKKHRIAKHTHHPLDDANGNREALIHILNKYGQKFDRMGNE